MKHIVIFFIIVYGATLIGGGYLFLKNNRANEAVAQELSTAKAELSSAKTALESEKISRFNLDKKIGDARTNANFLSLALCPTLEATDKNAPCVKNSTEWFSQTVQSGTLIANPEIKTKMDMLLVSLSSKKRPTAKEFYDLLKPLEVNALKAISESLK